MNEFSVAELQPGDIFETPLYTQEGLCLTEDTLVVEEVHIERLKAWEIDRVVSEEEPVDELSETTESVEPGSKETPEELQIHPEHEAVDPYKSKNPALVNQIKSAYNRALNRVREVLPDLSQGLVSDAEQLFEMIDPMVGPTWHLRPLIPFVIHSKEFGAEDQDDEDYIPNYSLKTAVLSMYLAQKLSYPQNKARVLGLGGLVHDIGMLKLPRTLRTKTEEYTEEERKKMEEHPITGARMLAQVAELPETVGRITREHHELLDGSGYPEGLSGEDLHDHTRIVSLAMRYVAMFQKRRHRDAQSLKNRLRELLVDDRGRFDPRVRRSLLELFGLCPPGTFLKLETGHHAMVIEPDPHHPSSPSVKVFTDEQGNRLEEPYVLHLSRGVVAIDRILSPKRRNYSCLDEL